MVFSFRHILLGLVFPLVMVSVAKGQDVPVYSQYMFNMMSLNPAYVGSHSLASITGVYRKQWVGVPGAPQTAAVAVDFSARNNFLGIGLQLSDERIGVTRSTALATSYAIRIRMGVSDDDAEDHVLALGLQAGFSNLRADYNQVDLFVPYDPSFSGNVLNELVPTFGAGIYYHAPNFYVGLSSPNLIQTNSDRNSVIVQKSISRFQNSHIFLSAGYVFDVTPTLKAKPSLLVRALPGTPLQVDLNTNLWFNNLFAIGASYRTGDAVIGLFELPLGNGMNVGYAYSYSITNALRSYTSGTHEIMMRFDLNAGSRPNQSPRYF